MGTVGMVMPMEELVFYDGMSEEELNKLLSAIDNQASTESTDTKKTSTDNVTPADITSKPASTSTLGLDFDFDMEEDILPPDVTYYSPQNQDISNEKPSSETKMTVIEIDEPLSLELVADDNEKTTINFDIDDLALVTESPEKIQLSETKESAITDDNLLHTVDNLPSPSVDLKKQTTIIPEIPEVEPEIIKTDLSLLTKTDKMFPNNPEPNQKPQEIIVDTDVQIESDKPKIEHENLIDKPQSIDKHKKSMQNIKNLQEKSEENFDLNCELNKNSTKNHDKNEIKKTDNHCLTEQINEIRQQIDALKTQFLKMNGKFLIINDFSTKLIKNVRNLPIEEHTSYYSTHQQAHKLRHQLINTRKNFIELASLLELVEEALDSDIYTSKNS